jgi:hypothetical protein
MMSLKPELLRLMNTIEGLDKKCNEIWTKSEELHEAINEAKLELHEIISFLKEEQ